MAIFTQGGGDQDSGWMAKQLLNMLEHRTLLATNSSSINGEKAEGGVANIIHSIKDP